MSIMPSIDISCGKAVKRIRGVRGTGVVIGDPIKIAENLYNNGYNHIHVVDLDAAEGVSNNEEIVKGIASIGFKWLQIGGGIRDLEKASKLIAYGATSIVVSSVYFRHRELFKEIVRRIGEDRVILALDYKSDGHIYLSGWREKGPRLIDVLGEVVLHPLLGILFTYIDSEGTMRGIDRRVGVYANKVSGLREYAGGVSSMDDIVFLRNIGFDYIIVGMAFYKGVIGDISYVKNM